MTVPTETARSGPYLGNGVTDTFAYEFRILAETHLRATIVDGGGIESVLTLGADYSVTDVGNTSGGSVILTGPLASGLQLVITRNVPATQETDLENQGAFLAEVIETAFDKATMLIQQGKELDGRTVTLPVTSDGVSTSLPGVVADTLIGWNAAGTALENKLPNTAAFISFERKSWLDNQGTAYWVGAAGGTANALTLTPSPAITAYAAGQRFLFVGSADNTAAMTAAISGLTARDVQVGGSALSGGEILAGELYQLFDDGTQLQLSRISPSKIGHALMQAGTQEAARAVIGLAGLTEVNGLVPVGAVISFAGQGVASNWLFANGQNVVRAQWPDLFARLGTTFGAGDGSTTFGVPDLRGRVVAGLDDMGGGPANRLAAILPSTTLGAAGGNQVHALTQAQLAPHGHNYNITRLVEQRPRHADNITPGEWAVSSLDAPPNITDTSITGNGQPHLNVQPTLLLNKLIFAGREVPQT